MPAIYILTTNICTEKIAIAGLKAIPTELKENHSNHFPKQINKFRRAKFYSNSLQAMRTAKIHKHGIIIVQTTHSATWFFSWKIYIVVCVYINMKLIPMIYGS